MSAHRFRFIGGVIPLAAIVGFAISVPLALPAAHMVGGHCQIAQGCISSSWQPCSPNPPCTFMQCECNGFGPRVCRLVASCADMMMGCMPNKACFCIGNDQCFGL